MVQEVQSLNKRIENINVQRTKAEAKVDMLKKQLLSEISAYKTAYGVDLSDKNFAKLSGKVKAELSMVTETIKSEYELKEKVVTAIESGNYDEAYRLLGIEPENSESGADSGEDVAVKNEAVSVKPKEAEMEMEMEMDFGVEEEEPLKPVKNQGNVLLINNGEIPKSKATIDESKFGDLVVEDEEEESSISGGVMLDEGVKPKPKGTGVKGEGALDAVDSMGVEDDGDGIPMMDDETWGFGDILSGSQFQNN